MTPDPKPRPAEYVPPKEAPTTPNPNIPEHRPEHTEMPAQAPIPKHPIEAPKEEPTQPERGI